MMFHHKIFLGLQGLERSQDSLAGCYDPGYLKHWPKRESGFQVGVSPGPVDFLPLEEKCNRGNQAC